MYVGRFVVVAPGIGAYRVSSRSFPNRRVTDRDGRLTVGPTPDAPETDNPYVSYNCARAVRTPTDEPLAVVGNGSHVDPIAEKLELGYPARDALATPLLALDFEKDDYDTPGSPAWSAPRPRRSGRPPRRPRRRGRRRAHHRRHLRDGQPRALRSRSRGRRNARRRRGRDRGPRRRLRAPGVRRGRDRRRRRRNAGVRQRRGVANRPRRLRWGAALDPSGDRIERIIRCFDGCSEHHDAPRALDRSDEEGLSAGKEEDEE